MLNFSWISCNLPKFCFFCLFLNKFCAQFFFLLFYSLSLLKFVVNFINLEEKFGISGHAKKSRVLSWYGFTKHIFRWIPDGQLCPTVPNRSNYIHWIEDLLSSELIPARNDSDGKVRGFDIGTGANCIYPLLGASLLGWSFVGSGGFLVS